MDLRLGQTRLTASQIAAEYGVVDSIVRGWIASGQLRATNVGGQGHRARFRDARADLSAFDRARETVAREIA